GEQHGASGRRPTCPPLEQTVDSGVWGSVVTQSYCPRMSPSYPAPKRHHREAGSQKCVGIVFTTEETRVAFAENVLSDPTIPTIVIPCGYDPTLIENNYVREGTLRRELIL